MTVARYLLKWSLLGAWVGVLGGIASAGFLLALDWATQRRVDTPSLLFFLPLAGAAIGLLYDRVGKDVAGGNNLLLDRIHDPSASVPFRMAPMILVTTVLTHLCGGSAGREGTAVQMGGTLADLAVGPLKLSAVDRRILLKTGIAAGFGSVFGTPIAGAIFGLEVASIGRIRYDALVPCLVASLVGDVVCRALGIHHHVYLAARSFEMTPTSMALVVLSGILFAGASIGFVELTHRLQKVGKSWGPWLRPVVGSLIVIAMTLAVGDQTYNGLGLGLMERSFLAPVPLYAFALKIVFTSVTLGFGFKGGEVTPLFCIGATLGAAIAQVTHQDASLFAALGFVAVFAGCANTPLACAVMGIELFGSHLAVPITISCVLAYMLSGHRGIYLSQQVHHPKGAEGDVDKGLTLRSIDSANES